MQKILQWLVPMADNTTKCELYFMFKIPLSSVLLDSCASFQSYFTEHIKDLGGSENGQT